MSFLGEAAGLGAALSWAIAGVIFSRAPVPAAALNLFKNVLSSILLVITLIAIARFSGGPLLEAGAAAWGWLAVSGIAGIVIGDTCYFRSLQIMGPRRALVLTTIAPPLAGGIGWWFLGESIGFRTAIGMAATLVGIAVVLREPGMHEETAGHYPGSLAAGLFYGFLGALGQATGAVLTKVGIYSQEPGLDTLEASWMRLVTASAIGLGYTFFWRTGRRWGELVFAPGVVSRITVASFFGTFLGIWLSLVAFKHCGRVAVATTLTSLTPVFVLPVVAYFLRQRVSARAILGAILAVAGVVILVLWN